MFWRYPRLRRRLAREGERTRDQSSIVSVMASDETIGTPINVSIANPLVLKTLVAIAAARFTFS